MRNGFLSSLKESRTVSIPSTPLGILRKYVTHRGDEHARLHGIRMLRLEAERLVPFGGPYTGKIHRPIEVLSYLQRLTFADAIDQGLLEEIVISAPRLTSLPFINCLVSESWVVDRAVEGQPSPDNPVDTDIFVANLVEERRTGVRTTKNFTVNGVLRGERLKDFISAMENYI